MVDIKYKQFVIVPITPRMSTGKIASQVAHATFMALEENQNDRTRNLKRLWKLNGMCVIVLKCKSQIELMNIAKYCDQWGIPNHLYIDEGLTEIPMGTATCLATGILTEDQFWMFSQLELF